MQPSAKKLFLIDALGALISAFLLGVLLVEFKAYFVHLEHYTYLPLYLFFMQFMIVMRFLKKIISRETV